MSPFLVDCAGYSWGQYRQVDNIYTYSISVKAFELEDGMKNRKVVM